MKFTEHIRLKMKLHLVSISSLLLLSTAAYSQTQIIPAGTLIQCTNSEPKERLSRSRRNSLRLRMGGCQIWAAFVAVHVSCFRRH
jgi:hypothetical protein